MEDGTDDSKWRGQYFFSFRKKILDNDDGDITPAKKNVEPGLNRNTSLQHLSDCLYVLRSSGYIFRPLLHFFMLSVHTVKKTNIQISNSNGQIVQIDMNKTYQN